MICRARLCCRRDAGHAADEIRLTAGSTLPGTTQPWSHGRRLERQQACRWICIFLSTRLGVRQTCAKQLAP
eukprot:699514-Rhodomonas_salina.1